MQIIDFKCDRIVSEGLLIRWSLVRVRPGEPTLVAPVSKTPKTFWLKNAGKQQPS